MMKILNRLLNLLAGTGLTVISYLLFSALVHCSLLSSVYSLWVCLLSPPSVRAVRCCADPQLLSPTSCRPARPAQVRLQPSPAQARACDDRVSNKGVQNSAPSLATHSRETRKLSLAVATLIIFVLSQEDMVHGQMR